MSRYPSPAPEPARSPKPQRPSQQWKSVREAAEILGVSENTIRNWKNKGLISWRRVGPKLIKFDVSDLEEVSERFEKERQFIKRDNR